MTPDEVVASYINDYRASAKAETAHFAALGSLVAAIEKAALCLLPDGKRHPHQWRIPRRVLEQAERKLQTRVQALNRAADFEEIHDIVSSEIGSIHGIGPLTVYDVAHRIGGFLGAPPKLVYLHAGTRLGAAVFGLRGTAIRSGELPTPFSRLTAAEIEDCLCIYRDELLEGTSSRSRGSISCRTMPLRGNQGVGSLCQRTKQRGMIF
jgi:hypothetical protein